MKAQRDFASALHLDSSPAAGARVDQLIQRYRKSVAAELEPLVQTYNPAMLSDGPQEYRKMLELSAKMSVVGHACTEISGHVYDARRQRIGILFGACCFLADSFIDDFGEAATCDYLQRLEVLLTEGWFELRSDRERLFYVIMSRLFAERDILHPTVRQSILQLYAAQRQDVDLRNLPARGAGRSDRARLNQLKCCARNRSGHAILVLSAFLLPDLPLAYLSAIFSAGALVMYIDDHGDCYSDLESNRITFMNQVKDPERTLRAIFHLYMRGLTNDLPPGDGRDLLIAFLTRYYVTRVEKHRQQRIKGGSAWAVYE